MTMTTVNFDPDKKRIEDIFEGSVQLVIPRYQRTYAWSKDKAEEFYSDFIEESEKVEDNLAFLGTILFAITEEGSLEVIDGQQRLITITLFLAALRDFLAGLDPSNDVAVAINQIQNKIVVSSTFGSSYSVSDSNKFKLLVGVEIEQIFQNMVYRSCKDLKTIKPRNAAERKVLEAYMFFLRKFTDVMGRSHLTVDQRLKLAHGMLSKINAIEYIDIRVTNKEVAYNLFESHNAKGVALAKTDLIKNYYFGRLSGTEAEKNKKMDEWDGLMDALSDNTSNMQPDRFFYYFLQSYMGNFSSSSLYRRIKPMMTNHTAFFKLLKSNANLMIELKNSNTTDRDMNRVLVSLNEKLKVNQCFILLLSIYRNREKLSPAICKKLFILIEDFTYIYSGVTKSPTNALEKIFSKHAKSLEDELKELMTLTDADKERIAGRLLSKLKKDLQEITPNYSVFAESLSNLSYAKPNEKRVIRYTFEKIEYSHSKGVVLLGEKFTLDHIIAQAKSKGGKYDTIGNLVPLSAYSNSVKGSSDPTQDDYFDISNFFSVKTLNEQLGQKPIFDSISIDERADYIAAYAYNESCKALISK